MAPEQPAPQPRRILVLGLGNEIIADDAAGILAVRRLRDLLGQDAPVGAPGHASMAKGSDSSQPAPSIDLVESSAAGIALLETFVGHEQAIVLDAVATRKSPPGTILEIDPADLGAVLAPSPHYAGLPELLVLARELGLDFPAEIRILALEVVDPYTIGGGLSAPVEAALPELVARAREQLRLWGV